MVEMVGAAGFFAAVEEAWRRGVKGRFLESFTRRITPWKRRDRIAAAGPLLSKRKRVCGIEVDVEVQLHHAVDVVCRVRNRN